MTKSDMELDIIVKVATTASREKADQFNLRGILILSAIKEHSWSKNVSTKTHHKMINR